MKPTKSIISLLLICFLTVSSLPITQVVAQDAKTLTEAEKACVSQKPDYEKLIADWGKVKQKDPSAYESAFEEAQVEHHRYVGCMFDFAEKTVLKKDTMEPQYWMTPSLACLKEDELKKIIKATDPTQMLPPILEEHAAYKKHLLTIGNDFDSEGVITDAKGEALRQLDALNAKNADIGTLKRARSNEIDSSLMAIDMMFTSLKELRLSLVMHVNFECTLQFLEKYRKALAELRKFIEPLPAQLQNASITK